MAVLSEENRKEVWAEFMRNSDVFDGLTKSDLRAAVDAIDAFLNSSAAAINNAIPQPARGALTATQKAKLLVHVIEKRYIRGV